MKITQNVGLDPRLNESPLMGNNSGEPPGVCKVKDGGVSYFPTSGLPTAFKLAGEVGQGLKYMYL